MQFINLYHKEINTTVSFYNFFWMKKIFLYLFILFFFVKCGNADTTKREEQTAGSDNMASPGIINYSVMNIYPHDTTSFTEGLFIHEGVLYESTGPGGDDRYKSWAGPVDIKTGKPQRKIILDKKYFGEGSSILNGKLYQLTYKNNTGFVYDARTYKKLSEFTYPGEGWALTHDSTYLIMSDGSNKLQYLDPATLKVTKIIGVEDNNGPVSNINELEYISGYLYANQYLTNYVLKIDPASGKVIGRLDLTNLEMQSKRKYANAQETNGIAYDPATKKMFVTGKCWPDLYEIQLN